MVEKHDPKKGYEIALLNVVLSLSCFIQGNMG